jgi:hypothetical protein
MKSFQAESRSRASKLDEILNALELSPTARATFDGACQIYGDAIRLIDNLSATSINSTARLWLTNFIERRNGRDSFSAAENAEHSEKDGKVLHSFPRLPAFFKRSAVS